MRIIDILIIVACLATGYWIVNSIVGADKKNTGKGDPAPKAGQKPGWTPPAALPTPPRSLPAPAPQTQAQSPAARRLETSTAGEWYLVLDVPRDASAKDIQAAMKRRLAQAEDNRDTAGAERIRQAADYALRLRQKA